MEVKSVDNGVVNSEPQVITEAIAMCQDNEAVIPHRKRDHSELSKDSSSNSSVERCFTR